MDISNNIAFDSSVTATAESLAPLSGGYLDFFEVQNPNTAQVFLQLFDALVASVSLGTTTPTLSLAVPAGTGVDDGMRSEIFPNPPNFRTGIVYAVTTTATGSTAPTTACKVNFIRH